MALFETAVTAHNARDLMAQCASIEQHNPYIPSDFKWILDYKRFQAALEDGDGAAAFRHLKAAIALAPYREELLNLYRKVVTKTPANTSLALIVSCKRYEDKARELARQFDAAQFPYLIVTGSDTAPIDHPRAVQVDAPDNYEGLPRKVTAAFQWVYENVGSRVGVLKIDDQQILEDVACLLSSVSQLKQQDAYAGVAVTTLQHDRCWHWDKCEDPEMKRRPYGKPFYHPWARGDAYYLGAGPLEKFVFATMRFPGLLEGEYYEDKLVGDVMALEGVELVQLQSERDFGLLLEEEHRFVAA